MISIIKVGTVVSPQAAVPLWMLAKGGRGDHLGLPNWGYEVIDTIRRKITRLTPGHGFAINTGVASNLVIASRMGLPVSIMRTLVGAVLSIGLARGITIS